MILNRGLLLVSLIVLSSSSAFAATGDAQRARFNQPLKGLEKLLASSDDAEKVAEALLDSSARIDAFNLQALGKLYQDQDKDFRDMRGQFKDLEDAIGAFDKWDSLLKKAQADGEGSSTIQRLKTKQKKAKKDFVEFLSTEGWVTANGKNTTLDKTKTFIKDYDWASYSEDKEMMLDRLVAQLDGVAETEFDLSILEEGNGLHELRRELRWFLMEARVLNGMVRFKAASAACPVDAYEDLLTDPIARSKYASLGSSALETSPCKISKCLFLSVVQKVEQLGELKDESEAENNIGAESDETSPKIRKKAERIYKDLVDNEVLELLSAELSACKKN